MTQQERTGGPAGSERAFAPTGDELIKDIAEALDHIARAIAAIDHKLEVLLAQIDADASAAAVLAASLEDKSK
jgi:hypothetical protein